MQQMSLLELLLGVKKLFRSGTLRSAFFCSCARDYVSTVIGERPLTHDLNLICPEFITWINEEGKKSFEGYVHGWQPGNAWNYTEDEKLAILNNKIKELEDQETSQIKLPSLLHLLELVRKRMDRLADSTLNICPIADSLLYKHYSINKVPYKQRKSIEDAYPEFRKWIVKKGQKFRKKEAKLQGIDDFEPFNYSDAWDCTYIQRRFELDKKIFKLQLKSGQK